MSSRKLFLVSGGSGGIGAAVCHELATRGFRPIVGYHRNQFAAHDIAAQLRRGVVPASRPHLQKPLDRRRVVGISISKKLVAKAQSEPLAQES